MEPAKFSGQVSLAFKDVDLADLDIYTEDELKAALAQPDMVASIIDYASQGKITIVSSSVEQFSEEYKDEDEEEEEEE